MMGACSSGRSDFESGSLRRLERRLEQSDLEVCSRLTNTAGLANQATRTDVLDVGRDCHGELLAVVVDRFGSAADRDASARALEVQSRPRRDGVVWTYGPNTVAVFGPRDHALMRSVIRTLDDVGAR